MQPIHLLALLILQEIFSGLYNDLECIADVFLLCHWTPTHNPQHGLRCCRTTRHEYLASFINRICDLLRKRVRFELGLLMRIGREIAQRIDFADHIRRGSVRAAVLVRGGERRRRPDPQARQCKTRGDDELEQIAAAAHQIAKYGPDVERVLNVRAQALEPVRAHDEPDLEGAEAAA